MKTAAAIQAFLTNRQAKNLQPATIRTYHYLLSRFADVYPELPETPEEIESFQADLSRSKMADTSLRDYFIIVRIFYRFAADRFGVPDPMTKLRSPRITRRLRPTLEPDEVWRLLSQAAPPRDHAILCLLADTGIRAGELVSLRKRDIKENTIQVTGKTGQREVPFSDETRRLLVDLTENIGPDGQVFRGRKGPLTRAKIYALVQKYMTAAGINGPKLGPHRIRHAFGKGYLTAGGDLRSLQQIMGHASITTTEQYTALTQGDLISKHHQFTLLRSAQAAAQGSFLDKAGVLKEAEEIINHNSRR